MSTPSHPSPDTGASPVSDHPADRAAAAEEPSPDHSAERPTAEHAESGRPAEESPAEPSAEDRPGLGARLGADTRSAGASLGADWAAVLVAAVLVVLAVIGLLPSIPFLIK